MLQQVIYYLKVKTGGIYVDATIGGGGHSYHILKESSPDGKLFGIDRDKEALKASKKKLEKFSDRVTLIHDNYEEIKKVLYIYGVKAVDGVLIDLGVSSHQIDKAYRGFSYMNDGPLDMRMNLDDKTTARDLVNTLSEKELAGIIYKFGEEKWANRIARFIVEARSKSEIKTTKELVEIIEKAIPLKARQPGSHPAKKTFQALRIATNNELERLEEVISDAISILKPAGRIVIISFHSLEDRIVKNTFKKLALSCTCPPKLPVCVCKQKAEIKIITKKAVTADLKEIASNSRSKSAKLRAAEKL
jgi:16S rRNA (cytosine1402-N4)-methyltransferase